MNYLTHYKHITESQAVNLTPVNKSSKILNRRKSVATTVSTTGD